MTSTVNRTDYQAQGRYFLKSCSVTMTALWIDNIHDPRVKGRRDVYRVTFRRIKDFDAKLIVPRFVQSYVNSGDADGDGQYCQHTHTGLTCRKPPTPYDVLACLEKHDPGTLDDFASDFGSDTKLIETVRAYRAARRQWRRVSAFFTPDELTALQEIQ